MFGLGTWEILLVLAAALIFIGPGKLPDVAKKLGKGVRDFRRAMSGLEREVRSAAEDPPPQPSPAPTADADTGADGAVATDAPSWVNAHHTPDTEPDDRPSGRDRAEATPGAPAEPSRDAPLAAPEEPADGDEGEVP